MDKQRRDNLRAVIGKARREIEGSLRRQLVGYGLFTDASALARNDLPLRSDQEAHYQRVLDAVSRESRATGSERGITPETVARYIREAGGTWINRLAALRALEARGLLNPAAFISDEYGGLSSRATRLRERAAEEGKPLAVDEALQAGVRDACEELSESVRVSMTPLAEAKLLPKVVLKRLGG
jgi:hypothetical protein